MVSLDDIRGAMAQPGRDLNRARTLASQYVSENPDKFTHIQNLSRDECVTAVGVFRNDGMDDEQWIVEAWLLHNWEPMTIVGGINQVVDVEQILNARA